MSIENADFNETQGIPGLLFPFVPHSIESGFMQDSKNAGGGFALYGKTGEPGKVWATKPDGGAFIGIACRTNFDALGCVGYEIGDQVNVLKKGRLWVRVSGQVQAGQAAYITDAGAFTATSTDNTAITGGVFKSNAADGALAELEIA